MNGEDDDDALKARGNFRSNVTESTQRMRERTVVTTNALFFLGDDDDDLKEKR